MALNDKNIVIVPNIGSNNEPSIVFSATDASSSVQNISLFAYPTSNGTLSFESNNGQLFSVTNSTEGSIFSVNDISGIPSIEVLDNGIVKIAEYSGNILAGTATDNAIDKLQINGSITASGIIKSTIAQGTSPFNVISNTLVSNLNSQLLNGQPAAYYLATSSLVGTLAVANGGTGVTTSTGTGSVVLNNSPTFAGTITANNISYTGSLTGGTGIINIDSGNFYKTVSGNVGIGTTTPTEKLVVNGAIQSLSGTATAQNSNRAGYTFTNDNDTGMFNPSSGNLSLSTNGTDIVKIENANVGIGKSPTVAFDVNGQVKSTSISTGIIDSSGQIKSSVAQGTAPFTINSTTSVANLTIGGTASGLSSVLDVSFGGTGLNSLTANNVIIGNGITDVKFVAPGTVNNVLKSDGVNWISAATPQGTVTNVTGTSPILSTGGATPAISIQVANSTQSGYLSSSNWNTFDDKANTDATILTGLTTADRLLFANTAVPTGNVNVLTIQSLISQSSAGYNITGVKTDFQTVKTNYTIQSITHYLTSASFANFTETISNVYGFYASSNTFSSVVSNGYGFYGDLSGTSRYNLYMIGSAPNYLKGSLLIDSTSNGTDKVQINGSVNVTSGIISTDTGFYSKVGAGAVGQFNAIANSTTAATGWSKVILRNDGNDFYLFSTSNTTTEALAKSASWNDYRPFSFNIVTGNVVISGNGQSTTVGGQLKSSVAQGTAPFTVNSNTKVTNLNADFLDDLSATSSSTINTIVSRDINANFSANQITSTITSVNGAPFVVTSTTKVTNLNADFLDGKTSDTAATVDTIVLRDLTGDISANQFTSITATGIAPLVINSTTLVANLNADFLDGKTSSSTATADTMVLRDATGGIFANSGSFTGSFTGSTGILNIGSGQLYKDISGNVGIGNLSPTFKLEIGSTSDTTLGANTGNQIFQQRFNAKNGGNNTALEISNIRLANSSSDWNTAGYRIQQRVDAVYQAYIQFNGSYNSANNPHGISFGTGGQTTANAVVERIRILNGGFVGIGTSNPITILDVSGQIRANTASGTAPFVVTSNTKVTDLNADFLDGKTSAVSANVDTMVLRDANASISANQITSTATTGTAPLIIKSTTLVANLNADFLDGKTSSSTNLADTIVLRDSSSAIFANTGTFNNGIKLGFGAPRIYQTRVDYSVSGQWMKIAEITLANVQFSTSAYKIDILDPNSNQAVQGSINPDNYTYYVACERTLGSVVNNDPDLCIISGPAKHVRAVKLDIGKYEIQITNELQFQEYLVTIQQYAENATTDASTLYFDGTVLGNTLSPNIYTANVGSANNWFQSVTVLNKLTANQITSTITSANGAPFVVTSNTKVINLNADLLDDLSATSSSTANTIVARDGNANFSANQITLSASFGTAPFVITSNTKVINLNADFLDGKTSANTATADTMVLRDAGAGISLTSINNGQLAGFRNRIINGSCDVQQRNPLTYSNAGLGINTGHGGPDRYYSMNLGTSGSFVQSANTITYDGYFKNTVRQRVVVATTNFSSTNTWYGITQSIEGHNCYDLFGKPITLSFIFNTNLTGTYSIAINVTGNTHLSTFTATANIPTKVTKSVVCATPGGNYNDNFSRMSIYVGNIAQGTFQSNTLNVWSSTNYMSSNTATNWAATINNFIELTELQLEIGSSATPFERRPYSLELALCQRYLPSLSDPGVGLFNVFTGAKMSTTTTYITIYHRVRTAIRASSIDFDTANSTITDSTGQYAVTGIAYGGGSEDTTLLYVFSAAGAGIGGSAVVMLKNKLLFNGCELNQ